MEGAAEVELARVPDGVELRYADRGAEFDPTLAPAPDITAPLEERSIGGLGIHLMRQIMRTSSTIVWTDGTGCACGHIPWPEGA